MATKLRTARAQGPTCTLPLATACVAVALASPAPPAATKHLRPWRHLLSVEAQAPRFAHAVSSTPLDPVAREISASTGQPGLERFARGVTTASALQVALGPLMTPESAKIQLATSARRKMSANASANGNINAMCCWSVVLMRSYN